MRRWLALVALLLVVAVGVYWFILRDREVAPTVSAPQAAATLDSGEEEVVVSAEGAVVRWLPVPEDLPLPQLPDAELPKGGKLRGPMREQARILGATPPALRPFVERSRFGESGVNVILTAGIELRFGDASQAARKWKAAATVLADPSLTSADYVDLQVPSRPAVYGEGHLLPPVS